MQCLCGPDTSLCTNVASVHPSWLSPHFLFPFFPIFFSSPSIPLCRLYLVYPQFLLFPSSSSLSHIPLVPFLFQVRPLFPVTSSPFPILFLPLPLLLSSHLSQYFFLSPFCSLLSFFITPSLTFCLLSPQCCAHLSSSMPWFKEEMDTFFKGENYFLSVTL